MSFQKCEPKKVIRFLATWHLCLIGLVMLILALAHRLTINSLGYVSSPLIDIQFFLMIIIIFTLCIYPIIGIYLCFKRKWKFIGIIAINAVIGIVMLVVAMIINSPTLIYMT